MGHAAEKHEEIQEVSVDEARAHFATVLDAAARRGVQKLVIRRRGRTTTLTLPEAAGSAPRRRGMTREAIEALHAEFAAADTGISAVDDIKAGRR